MSYVQHGLLQVSIGVSSERTWHLYQCQISVQGCIFLVLGVYLEHNPTIVLHINQFWGKRCIRLTLKCGGRVISIAHTQTELSFFIQGWLVGRLV